MHSRSVALGLVASASLDVGRAGSVAASQHRGPSASFADFGPRPGARGRRPSDAFSTSSGLGDRDPPGGPGWAGGVPLSPSGRSVASVPVGAGGRGTPGSPQRDASFRLPGLPTPEGAAAEPRVLAMPGRHALTPGAMTPTTQSPGGQPHPHPQGVARARSGLVPRTQGGGSASRVQRQQEPKASASRGFSFNPFAAFSTGGGGGKGGSSGAVGSRRGSPAPHAGVAGPRAAAAPGTPPLAPGSGGRSAAGQPTRRAGAPSSGGPRPGPGAGAGGSGGGSGKGISYQEASVLMRNVQTARAAAREASSRAQTLAMELATAQEVKGFLAAQHEDTERQLREARAALDKAEVRRRSERHVAIFLDEQVKRLQEQVREMQGTAARSAAGGGDAEEQGGVGGGAVGRATDGAPAGVAGGGARAGDSPSASAGAAGGEAGAGAGARLQEALRQAEEAMAQRDAAEDRAARLERQLRAVSLQARAAEAAAAGWGGADGPGPGPEHRDSMVGVQQGGWGKESAITMD